MDPWDKCLLVQSIVATTPILVYRWLATGTVPKWHALWPASIQEGPPSRRYSKWAMKYWRWLVLFLHFFLFTSKFFPPLWPRAADLLTVLTLFCYSFSSWWWSPFRCHKNGKINFWVSFSSFLRFLPFIASTTTSTPGQWCRSSWPVSSKRVGDYQKLAGTRAEVNRSAVSTQKTTSTMLKIVSTFLFHIFCLPIWVFFFKYAFLCIL